MAITLRYTGIDTGGSTDELTYQEMNNNLKSFYYSSSLDSNTLKLHFLSGSTSHSIDLSSYLDNTNIYKDDGTLTSARTVTGDGNDITFNFGSSNFTIQTAEEQNVTISGLPQANSAQVLAIDASGNLSLMLTSSIGGGGTPGGSNTQVQYNDGGSFGGAAIYFDDVNSTVGINVAPYSNRALAISSSLGIPMRLQSTVATANRIQFVNASSNANGVLAGATDGDNFHIQQTFQQGEEIPTLETNFYISSSGETYLPRIATSTKANVVGYDTATGELTYFSTSSLGGGSATPGGSDTQVQFNDGGSTFGGDTGLTYNKTTNRLTITAPSSPTRTAPNLLLNSEIGNVAVNEVLGVIAANNATDQYSPANYPASIQFTADTNFSPGNYDARIGLFVNNNATETEALRLKSSGQNQLPQYGSGTFTGTTAKHLAVDSSGNVIETDISAGSDITQPSAVTHTFDGDIVNSANYAWVVELGSGAPNSGSIRMGHSSPGNKDITTVTAIYIHRTSGNSTVTSNVLDYLCEEGTLAFRTTAGSIVADTIKIKAVDNSNASYVIVYVDPSTSSGNISGGTSTTYRVDFQSDAFIPLLDQNYNRIVLNNLASSSPAAVLVPPTTANVGDYYLVEVSAGSSNAGSFAVSYANYITGATTTYNINRQAARYLAGTNTVSPVTLDYSSYGQAAILHLRVHKVAGAAASFALIGADKVLS